MPKKKLWLLLSALLVASVASAQPPACDMNCNPVPAKKVWRDADLRKPLHAPIRLEPSAETLAGLQARAFDAGFVGQLQSPGGTYYPPSPEVVRQLERSRRLPRLRYDTVSFYPGQPIYPFVSWPAPRYYPRLVYRHPQPRPQSRQGGRR